MIQTFQADNPLLRLNLPLSALCSIDTLNQEATIKPELAPFLIGVEAQRERGAAADAPQIATRYFLVFPGSGFMRIAVKVAEPAPSITQEAILKSGGIVRVKIEGFQSGVFSDDNGGARPYFKAARIVPIQTQPAR